MIKLLSILGSLGIVGTTASTVTACGSNEKAQTLNFTPLDQAIEKADNRLKNGIDKPKSAHQRLTGVVEEAKTQRQKANTQEIINKTTEKVEVEIVIFDTTMPADKTVLKAKTAEAKELLAKHRKQEDVELNLQTAINLAEAILGDPDVLQDKVDQTVKRLEESIEFFNSFPDLADKSQLQEKITSANKLLKAAQKSNTAKKQFEAAIGKAQAILDKESATQAEVDQATFDLEVEIRIFQNTADLANKSELKAKIAEAKLMLENDTNASQIAKDFFSLSITAAEAVLTDESASQENVDATVKTLQSAIEAFARAQLVDKTKLEAEIKKANQVTTNSNKPSAVNKVLQTAISKAQTVLNNKAATQAQVDQAVVDLEIEVRIFQSAMDLADKTELKAKIAEATKLLEDNRNNKTSYTIEAMELAIGVAQTIMDKETTSQDEVANTTAKLEEAIQIFNKSPNLAKDKSELGALIAEARDLLAENPNKNEAAKQFFELFIRYAQGTFDDPNATESDVAIEITGLKEAIQNFKNAK